MAFSLQAKPSQAKPSQAKPSQVRPIIKWTYPPLRKEGYEDYKRLFWQKIPGKAFFVSTGFTG